mgnify:CR=1 FL=1
MKEIDWDLIMLVHLKGAYSVTKAAWNIMREKKYGRIINTGSSAGIYGSFGQVNYSTAKLGLWGFTQSLAKEGEKRNIRCNCIAPIAGTRMTATVMPEEVLKTLAPDYVAPFVAFLASEQCNDNGALYEVGAGYIARQRWQRSAGVQYDVQKLTPEAIASQWSKVGDFSQGATFPQSNQEFLEIIMNNMEKAKEQAAATPAAQPSSGLKAEGIFSMMKEFLARGEGKALIPKVSAVFGFEITKKKGEKPTLIYEIDLKNGQGDVNQRKPKSADATFTMTDDDYHKVCMGKLNPQIAFMQGKMKIKGNMAAASKFTPDLFPAPTPENQAKYASAKL